MGELDSFAVELVVVRLDDNKIVGLDDNVFNILDDEVVFRLDNKVVDTVDDGAAVRLDDKIVVGLDGKMVDTTLDEAVVRLDVKVFDPLDEVVVTLDVEVVVTVVELNKAGLSGTFVSIMSSEEKRSGHSLVSWYVSSKARSLLIFSCPSVLSGSISKYLICKN